MASEPHSSKNSSSAPSENAVSDAPGVTGGPLISSAASHDASAATNSTATDATVTKISTSQQRAVGDTHDPESQIWYIYAPHWKTISDTQIESISDTWIKRTVCSGVFRMVGGNWRTCTRLVLCVYYEYTYYLRCIVCFFSFVCMCVRVRACVRACQFAFYAFRVLNAVYAHFCSGVIIVVPER